ncbi:MAG TPA: SGNH/GDSL hydrolase family protein, partial [Bacteroidia bacterium]
AIFSLTAVLLFTTCKKNFKASALTSGDADFTNYIAVGNSLTQGYQNGGVYEAGQRNSYPSIIAHQMKLVQPGMNEFVQPYFPGNGSGYIHLEWKNNQLQVVNKHDPGGYREDPTFNNISYAGQQLSNLGTSGIKLIGTCYDPTVPGDNYNTYLLAANNPYFKRMFNLGQPATPINYLTNVVQSKPTFFTSWLGNNDILGYASGGGEPLAIAIMGTTFYVYGLSDPTEFRKKYDRALDSLTKNGAKGIVATIPNVTSIPYFNLVNLQNIKGPDGAQLNVYIKTSNGVRAATNDDRILLPAVAKMNKFVKDSLYDNGVAVKDSSGDVILVYCPQPYGLTPTNPIDGNEVLDSDEFASIPPALAALNAQIKASAAAHHIPVVDMEDFLKNFESGFALDGVNYSTKYIEGGVFSLDGVHPNGRGYAIIANKFIEGINSYYHSNIPLVNINNYKGIVFP